jgi:hypothetical protein
VFESLKESGVDIGDITKLDDVAGYMPHAWTEDAAKVLFGVNASDPKMISLRKQLNIDLTDPESMTLTRKIRAGTEIDVGGTKVTFDTGSIKEINETLSELFPEYGVSKWLVDDAQQLTARYVRSASNSAAQAQALVRLLDVAPDRLVGRLEHMSTDALDKAATATANKEARDTIKAIIAQRDADNKLFVEELIGQAQNMRGPIIDAVKVQLQSMGEMGKKAADRIASANARNLSLGQSKKEINKIAGQTRKRLLALNKKAVEEVDRIEAAVTALRTQAAQGLDDSTPWPKVAEEIFDKRQGDRAAAILKLEELAKERAEQIARQDAALAQLQEIQDTLAFASFAEERLLAVLNDPMEMRRLVEEGQLDLWVEFTDKISETRLVSSTPTLEARQVAQATEAHQQLVRNVDSVVEESVAAQGQRVATDVKAVRRLQRLVGNSEQKVARLEAEGQKVVMPSGTKASRSRAAQKAYEESPEYRRVQMLREMFREELHPETGLPTGKITLTDPELTKAQNAATKARLRQQERWREIKNQKAAVEQAAADAATAREGAEQVQKNILEAEQNVNNPPRLRGGQKAQESFQESYQRQLEEGLTILDDVLGEVTEAERLLAHQQFHLEWIQNTRWFLNEMADGAALTLEEAYEEFGQRLGMDISGIRRGTRYGFDEGLDLDSARQEVIGSELAKQDAPLLYSEIKEAIDAADASAKAKLKELQDAMEMPSGDRQLINAYQELGKRRRDLDGAVNVHRRSEAKYREMLEAQKSGTTRSRMLRASQERVDMATRRLRHANESINRFETNVYEARYVRPRIEGSEGGRLPYEAEAIEMNARLVDATTPFVGKTKEVDTAIRNPSLPTKVPRRVSESSTDVARVATNDEVEASAKETVERLSREELEDLQDDLADTDLLEVDELEELAGDEKAIGNKSSTSLSAGERLKQMNSDPVIAAENRAKAAKARADKKVAKERLQRGEISPEELFEMITPDSSLKSFKVWEFLSFLPDHSKVRALRVLDEAGINVNKKVLSLRGGEARMMELVGMMADRKALTIEQAAKSRNLAAVLDAMQSNGNVPDEVMERLTTIASELQNIQDVRRSYELAAWGGEKRIRLFEEKIVEVEKDIARLKDKLRRVETGNAFDKDLVATTAVQLREAEQELQDTLAAIAQEELEMDYAVRAVGAQSSRTEVAGMLEEANRLVEFGARYASAIDAGFEHSDGLAARVLATMQENELKMLRQRASKVTSGRTLDDAARNEVAFEQFHEHVMQAFENLDPIYRRANMLRVEQRRLEKEAGADLATLEAEQLLDDAATKGVSAEGFDLYDLQRELGGVDELQDSADALLSDDFGFSETPDYLTFSEDSGFSITGGGDRTSALTDQYRELQAERTEMEGVLTSLLGRFMRGGNKVNPMKIKGANYNTVTGDPRKQLLRAVRKAFNKDGEEGVRRVLRQYWDGKNPAGNSWMKPDAVDNLYNLAPEAQRGTITRRISAIEDSLKNLGRRRPQTDVRAAQKRLTAAEKELEDLKQVMLGMDQEDLKLARRQVDDATPKGRGKKKTAKRGSAYTAYDEATGALTEKGASDLAVMRIQRAGSLESLVKHLRQNLAKAESGVADAGDRIFADWREVLGVAPDGYVSPLVNARDIVQVYDAYRVQRELLQIQLDEHQATLSTFEVLTRGERAMAEAYGLPARTINEGTRITDEAFDTIEGASARLREISREEAQAQQVLDDLGTTGNDAFDLINDFEAGQRQARRQQADLLKQADGVERAVEKPYAMFEATEVALERLDETAAQEVAEINRNQNLNKLIVQQNKHVKDVLDSEIKEVTAKIAKVEGKDYAKPDGKGLLSDFEYLMKHVDGNSPEGKVAVALYQKYLDGVAELQKRNQQVDLLKLYKKAAEDGTFTTVFKQMANEGYVAMGEVLGPNNMVAVAEPLARVIQNVEKSFQTGAFIEAVELANRFFKTYATLSVGFHVRNWMGATFMNFSEGVSIGTTREAYNLVGRFKENPEEFVRQMRMAAAKGSKKAKRDLDAIEAAFGSGASGRLDFGEIGKSNATSPLVKNIMDSKTADLMLGNWAVRKSQSIGTNLVEMPARVALALDSLDRGMTGLQAISRIKRVHFDYSDLSKFDKKMKALIPFWIFMSRNLPLQMQQMVLKPKAYLMYNSVIRNAGAENQDMLQWQKERNGFVLFNNSKLFGSKPQNIALIPDLQHNSMTDDLQKMDPRNPLRFLSQMNPMVRVPAEFALDKKFYSDSPFYDQNKAEYALLQGIPPAAQAARLLGLGPYENRSRLQSALNYAGIPLWGVDQEQMRREMARRAG